MSSTITGYHTDEEGHWVAELSCGHQQHVRHQPPFVNRPWTTTPEGRQTMLGNPIECHTCQQEQSINPDK